MQAGATSALYRAQLRTGPNSYQGSRRADVMKPVSDARDAGLEPGPCDSCFATDSDQPGQTTTRTSRCTVNRARAMAMPRNDDVRLRRRDCGADAHLQCGGGAALRCAEP
jgi:hypothetical protein